MAKRLIDANELYKKAENVYKGASGFYRPIYRGFVDMVADTPTADAVEVSVLEKWLYEIAMNNTGNPLCESCEEIIRRLPGLRKFAEEYGGQAPRREDV